MIANNAEATSLAFSPPGKNSFSSDLKEQVGAYIQQGQGHRFADPLLLAKILLLMLLAGMFYALTLQVHTVLPFFLLYGSFMLIAMVLAINSFHDASHASIFRTHKYNRWLMALVSLPLGINPMIWTVRHVYYHHTYPNIAGYDLDIEPNPVLRQTPFQSWSPQYQWQHLYWPLVSAISLPYLCWYLDWLDQFGKTPLVKFSHLRKKTTWLQFVVLKTVHVCLTLVLPMFACLGSEIMWWHILGAYFVAQMITSCFLVTIILGTHWAEADFFQPHQGQSMPHSWHHHAFLTACDWQPRPRCLGYWLGGLDLHLTHHLLPNYSHRHYPALAKIVSRLADKHQLPYRQIRYGQLLKMQQAFLRAMGKKPETQVGNGD